jgi:hypothetical protein
MNYNIICTKYGQTLSEIAWARKVSKENPYRHGGFADVLG